MKSKRPEQPLSWERWFEKQHRWGKALYPCTRCDGSGTIYDPATKRCPIEGNKMRPLIKCPKCGGEGRGFELEWRQRYDQYAESRSGEIADYDHYKKIYDDLALTEDQKKAVSRFLN